MQDILPALLVSSDPAVKACISLYSCRVLLTRFLNSECQIEGGRLGKALEAS